MQKLFTAAALLLAMVPAVPLSAQEPLLDILKAELMYQTEELSRTDAPPYYMNFRVTEIDRNVAGAQFGVLSAEYETHERIFKPHIRLGSYDFDNFRGDMDGYQTGGYRYGKTLLPLSDENPDAIRQVIWKEVGDAYKASVEQLERLRAADKVNTKRDDKAPDFSDSPVEKYYEVPLSDAEKAFDRAEMERRVKAYSAVFLDSPDIINGSSSIDYTVLRKYLVSSEGTGIAHNNRACRLMISAMVRTADGMELPLYNSYFAFSPDGLPSDEEVLADTRLLAETLVKMKDAPVVDPSPARPCFRARPQGYSSTKYSATGSRGSA